MVGHSLETGSPLSSRGRQATNEVVTVRDMDNLIRLASEFKGRRIEDAAQSANNPSPVEAEDPESSGIQRGRGTAYGGENPSAEAVQSVGKSSSVEVEDPESSRIQQGMGTAHGGENPSVEVAGKPMGVGKPDSPDAGNGELTPLFPG